MKVNVVKKVDIEVTQEDVKNFIQEKILAQDPDITIASIEFVRKLNPQRIEIEVDAYFGKRDPTDKPEPKVEPQTEDDFEPEVTTEESPEAATVGDIFGG